MHTLRKRKISKKYKARSSGGFAYPQPSYSAYPGYPGATGNPYPSYSGYPG